MKPRIDWGHMTQQEVIEVITEAIPYLTDEVLIETLDEVCPPNVQEELGEKWSQPE